MLIQCEKCRTIFNLDETLLKQGGSRVRCSRCKHLFTAYPPPQAEDVPEKAPAATEPPQKAPPDELILMGDEGPKPVLGKDEAFDAELESVYKDALIMPDLDDDEDKKMPLEAEGRDELLAPSQEGREAPPDETGSATKTESKKKRSKRGLRAVLLTLLLVLVAAIAAIVYLKPQLVDPYLSLLKMPEKEKPAEPGVRLLDFESVAGSFVDAKEGGQLFVIRGMVHNKYPEPRSHILIKGSILDNKGKLVESRVAYAGNTFTEDELKALPIDEVMKALQNKDGMARQNFNVPPGTAIPFLIVFDNLPDTVSEFAVEAVSSSPGV